MSKRSPNQRHKDSIKVIRLAMRQLEIIIKLSRKYHCDRWMECPHCRAVCSWLTLYEHLEFEGDETLIDLSPDEISEELSRSIPNKA